MERDQRTRRLLAEAAATGEQSRRDQLHQAVAELNVPLALGVAHRYHGRGIAADDIDQVALLGLWKAVLGYSPGAESSFAAYAVPTITGEVKRYFRDHGWLVRPPRALQEHAQAVAKETELLRNRLGREPKPADLSSHLHMSPSDLDEARRAGRAYTGLSLDASVGGSTHIWADVIAEPNSPLDQIDSLIILRDAVSGLCARDQQILRLRYVDDCSQAQIGRRLGISQMHVSRLLTRIHQTLRSVLVPQAV